MVESSSAIFFNLFFGDCISVLFHINSSIWLHLLGTRESCFSNSNVARNAIRLSKNSNNPFQAQYLQTMQGYFPHSSDKRGMENPE